jgi:hypothetical protein
MSRKILKVLLWGAIATSALASTSTASAWTTNGPLTFTMTTGALRIQASPGPALNCSGPTDFTGSLKAKAGALSGLALAADLQMHWKGCSVSGFPYTITCTPSASLNGASYSGSTTIGTVSAIQCVLAIPNCSVTITGALPVSYQNISFQLTVPAAGQLLSYTATGSTCSALGYASTGTYTWTNGTGGNAVYTVTSTPKPLITNP